MNMTVKFSEKDKSFKPSFGEVQTINGATFTPSVSEDGFISWTNDRNLPNPAPVNIKGEKGEKGDPGAPGAGGGTAFTTDETLTLKDGVLSVNTADDVESDNTLPVTSAAVATQVGNIEILLKTI